MNSSPTGQRPSLRDRQRQQTHETIFEGVMSVLGSGEVKDLSFASVASAAGISERTVYRHFDDLDGLLNAFWPWFVQSLELASYSSTAEELATDPPRVFSVFDHNAGLIRALISSRAGRAARDRSNVPQQKALLAAIEDAVGGKVPADDMRMLGAAVYAVYSSYGWASMRDFWGMQGLEAGNTAALAIGWMIDGYVAEQRRRKSKGQGG